MSIRRRHLGRGWAFPLRIAPTGGFAMSAGEADIEEAIWIILGTTPGERPMRPDFGSGLHALVFAPNTRATRVQVGHAVRDALDAWEARIEVLDVQVEGHPERAELLLVTIHYRVRSSNAERNLVYPFYLQSEEG